MLLKDDTVKRRAIFTSVHNCHILNSVQETTVYKFHELCQLQRSAEARSNALLAILNFQQLFQSGENIIFLKWRNESDVFGNTKMCA